MQCCNALLLGIAILIPWAAGCTTVRMLPTTNASEPADPEYRKEVDKLRENLRGYIATVQLTDGARYKSMTLEPGSNNRLTKAALDSARWSSTEDGAGVSTTWSATKSITIKSHVAGALDGLWIGLLAGALSGAILGFAEGDDTGGWVRFSAENKALLMGGRTRDYRRITGGLAGLVVGGEKGHHYTWESVPQN